MQYGTPSDQPIQAVWNSLNATLYSVMICVSSKKLKEESFQTGKKSVKQRGPLWGVPFAYINLFLYLCEAMRGVLYAFITKNKLD